MAVYTGSANAHAGPQAAPRGCSPHGHSGVPRPASSGVGGIRLAPGVPSWPPLRPPGGASGLWGGGAGGSGSSTAPARPPPIPPHAPAVPSLPHLRSLNPLFSTSPPLLSSPFLSTLGTRSQCLRGPQPHARPPQSLRVQSPELQLLCLARSRRVIPLVCATRSSAVKRWSQ